MSAPAKDLRASSTIRTEANPGRFLELQRGFYRGDPHFVPPLAAGEKWQIDPRKNPFFRHAEAGFFSAWRDGRCTGRVSACRDRLHDEFHGDRVGFFGHFEASDADTAAQLLAHAADWCRQRGATELRGPVDLSTNYRCGLLVEGDPGKPVMMMPYNPPHYAGFLEAFGLEKAKDLVALRGTSVGIDRKRMARIAEHLQKRNAATIRRVDMRQFERDVRIMWRLYEKIWERNWGFVPMPEDEFLAQARDLKKIAHPALLQIAEIDGEPVGFLVALPDVNEAVHACRGRLLPFGWWKFLRQLRTTTTIRVLTLGVAQEFRRAGVDVMMMQRVMEDGIAAGFDACEASWILEDNHDMLNPLATMGLCLYRRYRLYRKSIP